jgi:Family of unknown function (DUF6065)/Cupin-like domain
MAAGETRAADESTPTTKPATPRAQQSPMDLICYLHPGWAPMIRPAPATRAWMDATPEAFAYRCLPLNMANAHGWEILSPCGFEASWNGGQAQHDVTIRLDEGVDPVQGPVALFGQGVLTFHVQGIFRTPPGWNLWVSGPPNHPKDAISPLSGVIETDWSPYTFTMNWRFTRPDHWVRFEAGEPFCFLFPTPRAALEAFAPRLEQLGADPDLEQQFLQWSQSRSAFQEMLREAPPAAPSKKWQKNYYRGVGPDGRPGPAGHQSKLRLKGFDAAKAPGSPADALAWAADAPLKADRLAQPMDASNGAEARLNQLEQLNEAIERQKRLSPNAAGIERRETIGENEFLERFYAPNRPLILTREMALWPARSLWTESYLRQKLGLGDASAADTAELAKHFQPPAQLLAEGARGVIQIGPAGAFARLECSGANLLVAQAVGRQRMLLVAPAFSGSLYPSGANHSQIENLEDPAIDLARFPRLAGVGVYPVELEAGEMLYLPLGWWRQSKALIFSASVTFAQFKLPNEGARTAPT